MSIQEFYNTLIEQYIKAEKLSLHSQVGQLAYYSNLTIEEAIDDAVFGRYIVENYQYFSNHYKYFPETEGAQVKARELLLLNISTLKKCIDFLSLYNEVRRITQDIANLGLLFYYDTTLRIGASKVFNLTPSHIFLQRGSLAGAKASGIVLESIGYSNEKPYINKIHLDSFSSNFKTLEAKDIESLLCVYNKDIEKFMKTLG